MRQKQSTRVNWGWRVGKGVVSQVALDQSITKRQQTDKKEKRTEIYLPSHWKCKCIVLTTLFSTIHCQFLYSDYCGVFFCKYTVCYVLVFVSAFVSALDMCIILGLYKEIYYYYIILLFIIMRSVIHDSQLISQSDN